MGKIYRVVKKLTGVQRLTSILSFSVETKSRQKNLKSERIRGEQSLTGGEEAYMVRG